MKATINKPKCVHDDPRYVAAQANFARIQEQKEVLQEKISSLESELDEPRTAGHRASLDQAALKVLGGGAPSAVELRRNLPDELSEAKSQLAILYRASVLAGRQIDQAATDISVELLPEFVRQNREHNREALRLDVARCSQSVEHAHFVAAHEADGVRGMPGILWESDLGAVSDPYSAIRGRLRDALERGVITEKELQDFLAGKNL